MATVTTAEALNGIAFDEARGHVWLTGKWWNRMYRVEMQVSGNELRMDADQHR